MGNSTQDPIDRFVEQFGICAKLDGMPRIAGRLIGWLAVHGGPASLSDLANTLSVSRASISTNARMLEQIGVLERVAIPGERQDFYRYADEPYNLLLKGYVERLHTRIEHLSQVMPHLEQVKGLDQESAQERLQDLRHFYTEAANALTAMMEEFLPAEVSA